MAKLNDMANAVKNSELLESSPMGEFLNTPKKRGRQADPRRVKDGKANENGLLPGWQRSTFVIKTETLERLKDYAYTERLYMRDAVEDIISAFLDEYEKNNELLKRKE